MWLVACFISAVIATALWYHSDKNSYRYDILALIFWGATLMVFIDHLMSFLNGEEFMDTSTDALLLGIVMVFFGVFIWEIYLLIRDPKGKILLRAQHA